MSGGRWNYNQCNLGYEMFPGCDVCYGIGNDERNKYRNYSGNVKLARKLNPMEDKQISELVFDVLCLIYSADWYKSSDIGEDYYREDVKAFKEKWLNVKPDDSVKAEIDKSIQELKEELYVSFGVENVEDG